MRAITRLLQWVTRVIQAFGAARRFCTNKILLHVALPRQKPHAAAWGFFMHHACLLIKCRSVVCLLQIIHEMDGLELPAFK